MAQIDFKQATVKIKDGNTPTPNEIEIKVGEGNLTYTERRNIQYTLDRGVLDEVREGDQVPVEVRFDAIWEYVSGSTVSGSTPTPEDALKQRGEAAAWTSSDADPCRPYSVDIEIEYIPDCTPADKEVITLPDFRYEQIDHDLSAGTLAFSGKCNVTEATAVRTALS